MVNTKFTRPVNEMPMFTPYLDALVHLDAGHDAELLDEVDEGLPRVRLLEEGLVEEDDAGDALQLRLGHSEEQLPVPCPCSGYCARNEQARGIADQNLQQKAHQAREGEREKWSRKLVRYAFCCKFWSAILLACSSGWEGISITTYRATLKGRSQVARMLHAS